MLLFKPVSHAQMSWIREGELSLLERLSANILKVIFIILLYHPYTLFCVLSYLCFVLSTLQHKRYTESNYRSLNAGLNSTYGAA